LAFFTKHQWLFMVMAIVVGLALGQFYYIAEIASYLIAPFLMVMLFGVFLQVPFKNLRKGFMKLSVSFSSYLTRTIRA